MDHASRSEHMLTTGLDVGDRYSHLCAVDELGEVVEEGRLPTTLKALARRFEGAAACRIALEVGTHSPWISRALQSWGHEVFVANPRKVRLITGSRDKGDRLDAERRARLARVDPRLLSPIRHRGLDCQQDRALLRSRNALVRARTQMVNHVRGVLKSFGVRLASCSAPAFHKRAPAQIPAELRPALEPVVEAIGRLTKQIRDVERQIHGLTKRYPETEVLRQVPGVGLLTSTAFVLTLEDPRRFPKSRMVGAYVGLTPRRSQSGNRDPELRISRHGDPELRRLLVQAAHYILGPFGPDTDLRRHGLHLAARGQKNAKKRAVVAVARKLAVLLMCRAVICS